MRSRLPTLAALLIACCMSCPAWSQTIVWGDKIFLTTAETDKEEKPQVGDRGPGGFPPGGFGGGEPPDVVYRWKVLCLDQEGLTVVIEAGPQLQVIATNKLDEMFWSSAAVVGESLFLRGVDHLYCIAK